MQEGMTKRWNERYGCGEILGKDGVTYFISARVLKQNGICSTEQRSGKEYVSCDKEVQEAGVLWSFDDRKEDGQGRDPVVTRLHQAGKDGTTYNEFGREVFRKGGPVERSRALIPIHHKVCYVKPQRQIGGWRDSIAVNQELERKRDGQRKEDEKRRQEQEAERKRQEEKEKEEERKRKEAEAKQQERDRERSRSRDRDPHRSQEENAQINRLKIFLRDGNLTRYLGVLVEEGYDSIDTLDVAGNDDLSGDPINMKRGHLCRLRAELDAYYSKDK
eukprot:gene10409-19181_t